MSQLKQRFSYFGILPVILLAAVFGGCSDDDPTQPNNGLLPTFTSIWPANVGNSWVFDVNTRLYEYTTQRYENLEDVLPMPSMEELYAILLAGSTENMVSEGSGEYRVEFNGEDISNPEVEAFQVERSWDNLEGGNIGRPWPLSLVPTWTRSSDRIASNDELRLNWVHLDGSLNPGHEFTVQLVENLTDDMFLRSRIWKYQSFEVMGETYENCLESFYVLDLGFTSATDENGNHLGWHHNYGYGVIIYAPEIGPVYCMQKSLILDFQGGRDYLEMETIATLSDRGESEIGISATE